MPEIPLTGSEAAALFVSSHVYLDDGDGRFDPAIDTDVAKTLSSAGPEVAHLDLTAWCWPAFRSARS